MCFSERKIPAAVVGTLSIITLLLSVGMGFLAVRYNNSGLSKDLGEMGDYTNFAFMSLLCSAILAFLVSICGLCVCKMNRPGLAICLGLMLFPISILVLVGGVVLTTVSHANEEDLTKFCVDNRADGVAAVDDTKEEYMIKIRETVESVDYTVGNLVSETMCTDICPCDLNGLAYEEQLLWLNHDKAETSRAFVFIEGSATTKAKTGYDIPAYKSFKECFDDLKEGKRDAAQVSDVKVKEYKDLANRQEFKAAMGFVKYFEGTFSCSGICDKSLFYFTKDLSAGPP